MATDIASRGIDVEDISHVINYDVPHTPEDYVHRIGRTGRVEAVGDAFTLMSPEEQKDVTAIERFLGRAIPRVLVPDFDYRRAAAQGQGHAPARHKDRRPARPPAAPRPAPAPAGPSHGRRRERNAPDRRRRRM